MISYLVILDEDFLFVISRAFNAKTLEQLCD